MRPPVDVHVQVTAMISDRARRAARARARKVDDVRVTESPSTLHPPPSTASPGAHGCYILLLLAVLVLPLFPAAAQERVLDDFETVEGWTTVTSDGVDLEVTSGEGYRGRGLRLDFDFHGGGGYAVVRKAIPLDLPPNYAFAFYMRGAAPANNVEFKLVDASGENVWWSNRRNVDFPEAWQPVVIRKRHISFAWGPKGGGDLDRVATLEIAITAGNGGQGSVWLDELTFHPLPEVTPYDLTPVVTAPGDAPDAILDGDPATAWHSGDTDSVVVTVDFLEPREYGGLVIDWHADDYATAYTVEISDDGRSWEATYTVDGGNGGRDYLYLPEHTSQYVRLVLRQSSRGRGFGIRDVEVKPLDFASSPNVLFEAMAEDAPRGRYPRYLTKEQAYWTVVGVSGDTEEALMNTDGLLEVGKTSFSIEPFLYVDGQLVTWNDAAATPSLEDGYLPVPSVAWRHDGLALTTTAYAAGEAGASVLYARYRLQNEGAESKRGTLALALRPFQVNPSWQFLNNPGGAARVETVAFDGRTVTVNGTKTVLALTPPGGFGASTFDRGEVVEYLATGLLPPSRAVSDARGYASGALTYPFELAPGAAYEVYVAVPFHAARLPLPETAEAAAELGEARLAEVVRTWRDALDRVEIEVPAEAERLVHTLKSTLAYILINRDGPAIQPGSRSYERSWIRDGALTSTALLQLGHTAEVRDFIAWYAGFQYPGGKVPCCVDHRGADPVPEHDSHGEFIYLVSEYYRYTRDVGFLAEMWPHVVGAVAYIDTLRHQRLTDDYRTPEQAHFYGILPPSISHEGYAAKPMHSYWDDLFALKGLKDAADMARVLGEEERAARFAALRDTFRTDLYASMRRAMEVHGIDYIPGAADLGDFDATSTTIAVAPVGELAHLPQPALQRTFDRYLEFFRNRRDGHLEWEAYTPYELRTVGTFVHLGRPAVAHELLDFFFADQRPAAWNAWAEVVWNDPAMPRFIGDLPHTWVGSDYVRSVRSFFAYEREEDDALVLGAGIPEAWVAGDGVRVRRLPTYYGPVNYTVRPEGTSVRIRLSGDVAVPPGGLVLRSPRAAPLQAVSVDGAPLTTFTDTEAVIHTFPADVVLSY